MSVSYAPVNLRLPPGFQNLLEGLAREVLRSQPEDLYSFAAGYFRDRLTYREDTGVDDAKIGAEMEKRIKGDGGIPLNYEDPKVENAVVTIQSGFRGYRDRKIVAEMRSDRSEANKTTGEDENQTATDNTKGDGDAENREDEEVLDIDLEDPELNKAAIKIQASFRGHTTRKDMQKSKDTDVVDTEDKPEESSEKVTDIDPDHDIAAIKIQSTYRGYRVRQGLKRYNSVPEIDPVEEYRHQAATKIQSTYRGFRTRKQYRSSSAGRFSRKSMGDIDTTTDRSDFIKTYSTEDAATTEDIQTTEEASGRVEANVKDTIVGEESELPTNDENKSTEPVSTMNETETEAEPQPEIVTESGPQSELVIESEPQPELTTESEPQPELTTESEPQPELTTESEPQPELTKESEPQPESQQEPQPESEQEPESKTEEPKQEVEVNKEEEIDIDLNDPEVSKAAIKIQASFRGHATRKNLQSSKPEEEDNQ